MNEIELTSVVAQSSTKIECLNRLGLEHNSENFRKLSDSIRKFGIDASHLQGIKASFYIRKMR